MNKVFKALQQAQRDRALGRSSERDEPAPPVDTPVAETPPAESPRPARSTSEQPAAAEPDGIEPHLVSLLNPISLAAEQYRTLRHIVEQAHRADKLSVLAVSAPAIGDGKTTTAINLAGALAQAADGRVLLVDGDLRNPSVSSRLALADSERGLVDLILDPTLGLDDVVRQRPPFNLSVLPAGPRTASPYELLKSPRLGEVLAEARERYDYVVLDTPPLVPIPDCRIIGKHVDSFLLVVTAHKTRAKVFDEALRVLGPSKILGLVFNRGDSADGGGYYAGYSYAAGYLEGGAPYGAGNGARPWYLGGPLVDRFLHRWGKGADRDEPWS